VSFAFKPKIVLRVVFWTWLVLGAVLAAGSALATAVFILLPSLDKNIFYAFAYFKWILFPIGVLALFTSFLIRRKNSFAPVFARVASVLSAAALVFPLPGSLFSFQTLLLAAFPTLNFFVFGWPPFNQLFISGEKMETAQKEKSRGIPTPLVILGIVWIASGLGLLATQISLELSLWKANGPGSGGAPLVMILVAALLPFSLAAILTGVLILATRTPGKIAAMIAGAALFLSVPLLISAPLVLAGPLALGIFSWTAIYLPASRAYYSHS